MNTHLVVKWSEVKWCPTLCDPLGCSLPGSSVHGIFQARILEWVAISSSRGSSWPRDRTQASRIVGRCFTTPGTIVRKSRMALFISVRYPRLSSSSCHRNHLSRKWKPQEGENTGAASPLTGFQRSAWITPTALWRGLWCYVLQMARLTGCSQWWITHCREHSRWIGAAVWTLL